MPVFCTLFNITNEHLHKELGLLPYGMHEFFGYDASIATYINGSYDNLKYLPGLKIIEVPRVKNNWQKDACIWLWKNAKKIDVLNLYHLARRNLPYALIYKLRNPKGKIYLKMDGINLTNNKKPYRYPKTFILSRLCTCISTEFQENVELISKAWEHEIVCVPNPVHPREIHEFQPFSERENIILYVGRIEREKGSHTLLNAFAKIANEVSEYKLKLVGNVTEKNIVDDFKKSFPELNERVIFYGAIYDREKLTEIYRSAKIFAFPSRVEGCPISLAEALTQGDFAVTSNIRPNELMTQNFKFALGSDVDDVDGLAKNLLYACMRENENEIEKLAREGYEAATKRCDLRRCCETIHDSIK